MIINLIFTFGSILLIIEEISIDSKFECSFEVLPKKQSKVFNLKFFQLHFVLVDKCLGLLHHNCSLMLITPYVMAMIINVQ